MRLLVCGSRTFNRKDLMWAKLDEILEDVPLDEIVIIQGMAPGADTLALEYALEYDLTHEDYPADWKTHGRKAGFLRNTQMLEEGKPTDVAAFVDKPIEESRGTHMMCKIAKEAGVPVKVFTVTRSTNA